MDTKENWTIMETDVVLGKEGKRTYQAMISSLIYLMLGTRLDLAFAINKLAQYYSNPTDRHWKGVKRILRFVKKTADTEIVLGRRNDIPAVMGRRNDIPVAIGRRNDILVAMVPWKVIGFFNEAYMDDTQDRYSTMAYIFFYDGCAISWASKKQQTVALSTTEAEYLAGT